MPTIESSVSIGRPIDVVFGFFSDPRNESRWVDERLVCEKLTDGPIGVGTRFLKRSDAGDAEVEVTEFVPGKRWSFRVRDARSAVTLQCTQRFEGDDRGTKVIRSVELAPRGLIARLTGPVQRALASRRHDTELLLARDLLEQRSIRPPA